MEPGHYIPEERSQLLFKSKCELWNGISCAFAALHGMFDLRRDADAVIGLIC